MPRKKKRRAATSPTLMTAATWRWRSFPVFFAFVCGAFVMGLLNGVTNPVGLVAFTLALFGVAFGLAHMGARWLVERRERRRQPTSVPPAGASPATEQHPRQGAARRR